MGVISPRLGGTWAAYYNWWGRVSWTRPHATGHVTFNPADSLQLFGALKLRFRDSEKRKSCQKVRCFFRWCCACCRWRWCSQTWRKRRGQALVTMCSVWMNRRHLDDVAKGCGVNGDVGRWEIENCFRPVKVFFSGRWESWTSLKQARWSSRWQVRDLKKGPKSTRIQLL